LTKRRVLETVTAALASPHSVAYIRKRLAERLGSLSRDSAAEATERGARLQRTEERIRGLIVMQAEGDRSPLVAEMRADLEAQAEAERSAIEALQAQAEAPIRLRPVELITDRVIAVRALADSENVQQARARLSRYFRDGAITLTPELGADGEEAYVARGDLMPLVFLTENAATPSELAPGGRCLRSVARGRFARWDTTRVRRSANAAIWLLRRHNPHRETTRMDSSRSRSQRWRGSSSCRRCHTSRRTKPGMATGGSRHTAPTYFGSLPRI